MAASQAILGSNLRLALEDACRSTTCDESLISVTIRNLRDDAEEDDPPAAGFFKGPIACAIAAPSRFGSKPQEVQDTFSTQI